MSFAYPITIAAIELIRQNSMPVALLRLAVNGQPLTPETPLDWRFDGDLK
jgi:hypothetical protein